jgi:hypothetical protein
MKQQVQLGQNEIRVRVANLINNSYELKWAFAGFAARWLYDVLSL